ncbi:MAG TPA: BTAD domain-containing putative transcriptional regulator [Fimbriimonadaceae bacterium]|jgi:predicted ATPase/DNA-binding SARP family transcriptional activator
MLQRPWHITLFGGFGLKQRSRDTAQPVSNQMAMLLALMADRLGCPQQRNVLLEELWPGVKEDVRRNRFRVLLAELRQILETPGTPPGSVLCCDRNVASLSIGACWVDTNEFERIMQRANQAQDNESRMEQYRLADGLYAGEFLSGRNEEWVQNRRLHYARLQSLGQFRFAAQLEETGDLPGAMVQIARSIEADPLREAPRRRALRLLVESGDVGSALAEYVSYKTLLRKSVGLSPTAEFQDWIRGVKGWAGARRVPKLQDVPSQPAKAATQQSEPAKLVLPPELTSFVGRNGDVAYISQLLPLYRWITLTGPGGIGKSRLAVESARINAGLFGAGVIHVPMSEAPLAEAILQQVGIESSAPPLETLHRYFGQPVGGGRNAALIILDGIEQTAETSWKEIQLLLAQIPNCTILATSRRKSGLLGEHEYSVLPIAIPDPQTAIEDLLENPSVRLFCERAQTASSRFRIVEDALKDIAALCRRLGGLPLAIELAAAQAGAMAPGQILRKISDFGSMEEEKGWREPRYRSLQASLAVSLEALSPEERRVFCLLCVFRGGFGEDAAFGIAGGSLETLSNLADHSLLIRSPNLQVQRFSMLGIVREFGWSRLSKSEKDEVQHRFAAYFQRLVFGEESPHFREIKQLPNLRLEVESILLATEWMLQIGQTSHGVKLIFAVLSLGVQYGFLGKLSELISVARRAGSLSDLDEAMLNASDGMLACLKDDAETARQKIGVAVPVFESAGLHLQAAGLRWTLGYASYLAGDYEYCLSYASEPEKNLGKYEDRIEAFRINLLGMANCELGNLDLANQELSDALSRWHQLDDKMIANMCEISLARVAWKLGRLDESWARYKALAKVFEGINDPRPIIYCAEGLGRVTADFGRFSQATRLFGAAQRFRESIGMQRDCGDRTEFERAVATCKKELGPLFDSDWQAGYGIAPTRIPKWIIDVTERR